MTDQDPAAHEPHKRRGGFGRWFRRFILLVVVPIVMVIGAAYWYAQTGRYVTTENAYVKAHLIAVSTNIDGRVTEVAVRNNQLVEQGQVLFRMNPDPHWLAVKAAEAEISSVRNELAAKRAEYHQTEAEIQEAEENVAFYQREMKRQKDLANRGVATRAKLDQAEFEVAAAKQRVNALRQKIQRVLAELGGDPKRSVELHPSYAAAVAEKDMAQLRLSYTEIKAPAKGIVTQFRLEPGEWLEEGNPAFGLVVADDNWIVANLKETQLTHVREGQKVEVVIDAYPDVKWPARISTIAPATGAEFAVLPPQNASGNWVKVVQRVPVRIDFISLENRPTLRAGMTASISIDTNHKRELLSTVKKAIAGMSGS